MIFEMLLRRMIIRHEARDNKTRNTKIYLQVPTAVESIEFIDCRLIGKNCLFCVSTDRQTSKAPLIFLRSSLLLFLSIVWVHRTTLSNVKTEKKTMEFSLLTFYR